MRADSIGLFWEDLPTERGSVVNRVMPEIPPSDWVRPSFLPDLSGANCIALDVETWDPELTQHGPGWARGIGHIVGISVGTDDGFRAYYPMRHETSPEQNIDPEAVLAWARVQFARPHQAKIGANLTYDLGWLCHEGVEVKGELIDVQYAEALLNEEVSSNDLESLGQKYLGEGKESPQLYTWLADWFGGKVSGKQRKWIYRAPPSLVGPYAISDVDLPLRVARVQYTQLVDQGLYDLFRLECRLIPLLIQMRMAGVSVDLPEAHKTFDRLGDICKQGRKNLKILAGSEVNINSGAQLKVAFTKLGIPIPTKKDNKTKEVKQTFEKGALEKIDHPFVQGILEIKKNEKIKDTFIKSYIIDSHVGGKVYAQFHPLRGGGEGDKGTRSGRFSSSGPNLQNIPSRDPILGPLCRGVFIPDEGHEAWRKYDYSQIEYRFLAHYASGPGADDIRRIFNDNPDADYHEEVGQMIHRVVGIMLERKAAKTVNFGLVYGMGKSTLGSNLNLDRKGTNDLFDAYHKGVPFVKTTMDSAMEDAQTTGLIKTILGRRSRFDKYEPADWNTKGIPLPYEQAIRKYPKVKRAMTHKALNRMLQGSAADLMKVAMLQCWDDGIFDVTGVPRLTVHDELDFSDPGGKAVNDAFTEMLHVMETCMKLKVPIKADFEIGPNWGHVK